MRTIEAYNALTHPIDLPGGMILEPGKRGTVDPDDLLVSGYLAEAALVGLEGTEREVSPPDDDEADEPVEPAENATDDYASDTPAEPEVAPTKPTRSKRGGNGNATGEAASTTTTED